MISEKSEQTILNKKIKKKNQETKMLDLDNYFRENSKKVGPIDLHAIVEKMHKIPKKKIPTFEPK